MQWLMFAIVMWTAACGGKPSHDCTAIAQGVDNLTAQTTANAPDPAMQAGMPELSGKLKGVLIKRCADDKWSSEDVRCFTSVRDRADMQVCVGQLSEDRRRTLVTEVRAALMDQGVRDLVAGARRFLEEVGLAAALVQQAETARAESDRIAKEADRAKASFDAAVTAARDASEKVDKLARSAEELDKRLGAVTDALMAAQNDADRAAAAAQLAQLKQEAAALRARIDAAAAEANAQQAAAAAAAAGSAAP